MDDTYQSYLKRVVQMTLPDAYAAKFQHIQESPKFVPNPNGVRQAAPFPGYSVITPPWQDDRANDEFYADLKTCGRQLLEICGSHLFVALPPDSLHLTIADLIWDSAYRDAAQNPEFEGLLRDRIADTFRQCETAVTSRTPIRWQIIGFMVMTRAIGVCLVPKDEQSYDRIVQLRRAIYQNAKLIELGIEQQYHFTAHVTLGYWGEIPPDLDRDRLSQSLADLNHRWLDTSQEIWIQRAELRKFDDMTHYDRQPDWPVLEF
ncbi:MAG TPA: DUF1868 domain-containing protein [Oscillatoriales cyanobacterium M59_W2019_021]|nr:DUF1868 domain-containing protein [Oscillatoriales cyanobacterium M4454_W2019_049]HIK49976.1 DUF1868 domain-containing protein [Oscillatoriales cyanobacterium M59_W2019_021]